MIRQFVRGGCLALALTALAAGYTAAATPAAASGPPARYYLALGDSIAYGFQTDKALAGRPPEAFDTGYVDLLSARLRGLATVNYSCPGESTVTFRVSCPWKDSGHRLHDDYSGAQLGAALSFLHRHRGRVELITVSLNGNDINDFVAACAGDPDCIQRTAPDAVARYAARLRSILLQLRAAAPAARIVVVGAYDPNVGRFAFSDPLFASVNAAQAAAAAAVRARFADPFPVFNPQGDPAAETAAICALTLICTKGDAHPSDAGYRALADVIWRVVRRPGR
ncbi:MAG TPA: SGNH/GDSL hydrolase family protein [Dactylosporangium sp.]|nr:SGNH/GDSL hydrolase family protein [Dactylosporangium sp.]